MNDVLSIEGSPADLVPFLLLLLITMTVSGVVCMFSVLYYLRNRRAARIVNLASPNRGRFAPSPSFSPLVFERPACWLAIKSRNIEAVREALGLENPTSCSWIEGLAGISTDNRLFLSPPIRGWILVFGPHIPRPSDDIDVCYRFLARLSEEMGEVQYFCMDSVTYEHAWARLVDGVVVRAYAWFRETLWNQGAFSEAERRAGVQTYSYGESPDPSAYGMQDRFRMNSDRVFQVASRWSIDPSKVNQGDFVSSGLGLSGTLSDQLYH